jgi:hypothetical protein
MSDLEKIKREIREWQRKELEERWREQDRWDDEAKRESDYQKHLDEKRWKQETHWLTEMQRDIGNQRRLDDIDDNLYREKLKYRKWAMRALEDKWRQEDEWDDEANKESDYQQFLNDKNFKKW